MLCLMVKWYDEVRILTRRWSATLPSLSLMELQQDTVTVCAAWKVDAGDAVEDMDHLR